MKLKVNDCSVFFPQRVLSVEDKEVSGVYLNDSSVCSIQVDVNFERILQAQSDGKLTSNNQDNPLLIVFISDGGDVSVLYEKKKKVLFCQSYLENGNVHILKLARKKEFSTEEQQELIDYINASIGDTDKASEHVEVDIDGNVFHVGYGDEFVAGDFLCASVTPYLRLVSQISVGVSKRGYSMVVLDVTSGLVCTERYDVISADSHVVETGQKEGESPLSGLDAYYKKIKSSSQ